MEKTVLMMPDDAGKKCEGEDCLKALTKRAPS